MTSIYLITGPAGVGKSTTSKKLAEQFKQSAYIEGDVINHMVVGGYVPPWESDESLALVWKNIADLSINFLKANKNVIIDYVTFPEEVETFSQRLYAEVQHVKIYYVVLRVDNGELLKRDAERPEEYQMGQRCIELLKEFEQKGIQERHIVETTNVQSTNIDETLQFIKNNPRFLY
ncbi:AAA family ATPase [Bacillus alkalicellulosilyticus]|uniref:AAA family ATPase n=1 Tax=Alkalihalobacterium alkalicellulosilyticum TaxID=1912214 RepID=UPI000995E470|nr:AAA family ATPase [Bacillus alkalicellulosilyticus]